jgi:hypothetical protein
MNQGDAFTVNFWFQLQNADAGDFETIFSKGNLIIKRFD